MQIAGAYVGWEEGAHARFGWCALSIVWRLKERTTAPLKGAKGLRSVKGKQISAGAHSLVNECSWAKMVFSIQAC